MIDHLRKWLPTYIPSAVAILAIVFQAANGYVTAHPKIDFGVLLGVCVHAVINHWITSPADSAVVAAAAAKEQQ